MAERDVKGLFEKAMRIIEEMRMEMRRGFGLDSGTPVNNNNLEIKNHHSASGGGFITGTSEEMTLECEENQLVFKGENEAAPDNNTKFITDMVMVGEKKDPTEGLRYQKCTAKSNAMKVRSLLSHALAEPPHQDPPPDQPPPPTETLSQFPPPKPPDPHPRTLVKRWYTCSAAKPPQLDPSNVRDWDANKLVKSPPPDLLDPFSQTSIKSWFSQTPIKLSSSDSSEPMAILERKMKIREELLWCGGSKIVEKKNGEEAKVVLGYHFSLMGQAQLRKEIKDQKDTKIEMGSFIPACKIPTVETVKHARIEEAETKLAITVFSFLQTKETWELLPTLTCSPPFTLFLKTLKGMVTMLLRRKLVTLEGVSIFLP